MRIRTATANWILSLSVLTAITLSPYTAFAFIQQPPVTGVVDADGFDAQKLDKINQIMSKAQENEQLVGCSALVVKDGREIFFNTWGFQDRDKEMPMKRDTIFRIYSMSKPITSVATMQLVEQGKLKLDAPVSDYLKEFSDLKVARIKREDGKEFIEEVQPKRAMTVRDLLRHTSGLCYGFFGRTPVDRLYVKNGVLITDRNIAQTVTKLGKIPLKNQPGSRFEYGASTDVLGRLVEVASGMPFDKYLQKNIFQPLNMKDTGFSVPTDKQSRFAEMYRANAAGKLQPSPRASSFRFLNQRNAFFSGGGGLCSTIDDYLNFATMLANEGKFNGQQVLKKSTLDEMYKNQLADIENPPRGFKFGLGFRIADRKQGTDYSWGGIAGTRFWVNPELKMISIYMIQINPYGNRRYGSQVRDIAYDALK